MSDIVFSGVSKTFDRNTVLDEIDLTIDDGEFLVLLGPSGSGKSTTLRILAGLEDVSSGTVTRGDRVVSSARFTLAPHKRGIGFVFQNYALLPHLSVLDNVAFPIRALGYPRQKARDLALEALDLVHLADYAARNVAQLSGGQRQRVALARAIAARPQLILFDEPLSNLDARLRESLKKQIKQLHAELGFTAVYVTHSHEEALSLGDRIALFDSGRIVQVGDKAAVYTQPASRFVAEFVGFDNYLPVTVESIVDRRVVFGSRELVHTGDALPSSPGERSLRPGDEATYAFRSTHVRILREEDANPGQALSGTLRSVEFVGTTFQGEVDVDGTTVRGVFPSEHWSEHIEQIWGTVGERVRTVVNWPVGYVFPGSTDGGAR